MFLVSVLISAAKVKCKGENAKKNSSQIVLKSSQTAGKPLLERDSRVCYFCRFLEAAVVFLLKMPIGFCLLFCFVDLLNL